MSGSSIFAVVLRHALSVLAFLIACLGACAAIGAALPFPEVPLVTAKLAHFREHANRHDTLFIGSSRIYHQIIPSQFDRYAASCGHSTRSFNASIDSLRPPELNFYIDELLRCRPQKLRWVFLETGAVRVPMDPDKRDTVRNLYWHDFERLRLITRVALADRKTPKKPNLRKIVESYQEPFADIAEHAAVFFRRFSNLGRGSIFTDVLSGAAPSREEHAAALGPAGDGYRGTGGAQTITPEKLAELERELGERRAKGGRIHYADEESQRAFEAVLQSFESHQAQTVQIIPPTAGTRKFLLRSNASTGRLVLDYSDLEKYAVLYDPQHRIDPDHLNHSGAEIFTRLVAEEWCAAVSRRP